MASVNQSSSQRWRDGDPALQNAAIGGPMENSPRGLENNTDGDAQLAADRQDIFDEGEEEEPEITPLEAQIAPFHPYLTPEEARAVQAQFPGGLNQPGQDPHGVVGGGIDFAKSGPRPPHRTHLVIRQPRGWNPTVPAIRELYYRRARETAFQLERVRRRARVGLHQKGGIV